MPNEPVTVYECETGAPAVMHSIDALEAVRLGHYAYAAPEGKEADPDALSRARARFMGGGLDQAELKSPEQRAEDTQAANAIEAQRRGMPAPAVAPVVTPVAAAPAHRGTKADRPEGEAPARADR